MMEDCQHGGEYALVRKTSEEPNNGFRAFVLSRYRRAISRCRLVDCWLAVVGGYRGQR